MDRHEKLRRLRLHYVQSRTKDRMSIGEIYLGQSLTPMTIIGKSPYRHCHQQVRGRAVIINSGMQSSKDNLHLVTERIDEYQKLKARPWYRKY
jgi:hypothetical protein